MKSVTLGRNKQSCCPVFYQGVYLLDIHFGEMKFEGAKGGRIETLVNPSLSDILKLYLLCVPVIFVY